MAESTDRDPRRRQALDRYWDAIVDGHLAAPDGDLDARQAAVVRRVHALAGMPIPEPDRADRLWRDLMSSYAQTAPLQLAPTVPSPTNGHRGKPLAAPRPLARPRTRPGRLSDGLSIFATVALVAVVLAMIFFIYHNQNNNIAIPPKQETPTEVPATPSAGWPTMLANNQRTASTDAAGPTGTFATLWTFTAASALNNVIVASDAAFLQSEDGTFYCLDRLTGQQRWALNTGGPIAGNVLSYPAVDGDTVYAAGRLGDVYALDVANGAVKWKNHLGDDPVEASILVQDGTVYTGTSAGLFVALNALDGSERWRFDDGQDFVNTFPAIQDGIIYVGGPQSVRAIDATTGTLVWETPTDGQVRGAAVEGGVVYAPTAPGSVYALAASDGHQIWMQSFPDAAPALSVAVSGGSLVAGFGTGGMVALEAETGKTIWQTPDSGSNLTASKVSIANGIVYAYFGPRRGILALDVATGQERGFAATAEIRMPPSIVDGILYAGSEAGRIAYAFASEGTAGTPVSAEATPATVPTLGPTATAAPEAATGRLPIRFAGVIDGWDRSLALAGFSLSPDGKIWAAVGEGTFAIFDLDGNLLETWGTPGDAPEQFDFTNGTYISAGVTWLADGSFYVQDLKGLQLFAPDRTFVKMVGSFGLPATGGPPAITVDPDGTLWAWYYGTSRIEHLDTDGTKLGGFDGSGTPGGRLIDPGPPVFDAQGRLYVLEQSGNRVRVFDRDGNELGELGANDPAYTGPYQPTCVAIATDGMIYVCTKDSFDIFDPQWHYLGSYGGTGSGQGQFLSGSIGGIVVNGSKTIFVQDLGNNRIQKFAIVGSWPVAGESTATPSA